MLHGLSRKCREWMKGTIDVHNACTFWTIAELFQHLNMLGWVKDYICMHASRVVRSSSFLGLPRRLLGELLSSPHLLVLEHILYIACLKWAKQHCLDSETVVTGPAIRMALGECLGLIRFPTMQSDIFDQLMAEYPQVLTVTEQSFVKTSQNTHEATFWSRDTSAGRLHRRHYYRRPLADILQHAYHPPLPTGDFRFDHPRRRSNNEAKKLQKYYRSRGGVLSWLAHSSD